MQRVTFKDVLILRADNNGPEYEKFAADCEITTPDTAFVYIHDNVVGVAKNFRKIDSAVVCDVLLTDEENFKLSQYERCRPCPYGYVRERNSKFEIIRAEITRIDLSPNSSDGFRIPVLGGKREEN